MALVYRLSGSFAAMSFFGAIIVIFSYLSLPVLRKHPTNMVFFLSVSDLLFSLKFLITALIKHSHTLEKVGTVSCYLQAAWAQFWGLASVSWNGMISLNLIIDLHKQGFARTASLAKFYHLLVWSLAALTTAGMFLASDRIGPSGDGTCWVKENNDPLRLLFFIPLLIYFSISIFAVILAFIRTSNGVLGDSARRGVMLRMISYVSVFLLCWSGPVVHRIYLLASNDSDNNNSASSSNSSSSSEDNGDGSADDYTSLWDAVGVSIQGFANAMVWLTNPSFFASFKSHVLDKYFKCLRPENEEHHPILSGIQDGLADSRNDINRIGQMLRKNMIMCILLGVQQSLDKLMRGNVTQKNYQDTQVYNHDDLWADDASRTADGQGQTFQFIDYAPVVFANIRELSNIPTDSYRASMSPNIFLGKLSDQLAKFSDGRSNSFFIFSPDKKFIIKTISEDEAKVLLDMLPRLHEYFKANKHSLINRFYGCHAVRVSHGDLIHVVVVGNVFSSIAIHETYDLKGSWVNRSAGKRADASKLGMDLDLNRRLSLSPSQRDMFIRQLQNDSLLLCSVGIMDYSLLLGFHFANRSNSANGGSTNYTANDIELGQMSPRGDSYTLETLPGSHGLNQLTSEDGSEIYCVGIIDVLQQYTRHKKMERFFKVYILQKDGAGLSSMAPRPYADRFSDAMKKISM